MSWYLLLSLDKTIYPLEVKEWEAGQELMQITLNFYLLSNYSEREELYIYVS